MRRPGVPRRRRRIVLRWLLGAVLLIAVLVLGAGLAATLLIDPNSFRPQVEAAAARATGGTLTLRGPIHIVWGLPLRLEADDLAFSGPGEVVRAQVGRVAARIAVLPLLTGALDIVRLDLLHPDVRLHPGMGTVSVSPAAAPPAPPSAVPGPAGGAARLTIGAVHVRGGRVTWRGTEIQVPRFDAIAAAPGADLVLSGEALCAGRKLTLSGESGPVERLLDRAGAPPWPVQFVVQGEGARLAVRGTLAAPVGRGAYALQVDAAATDLAAFAPLLPVAPPKLHDMSLSARLTDGGGAPPTLSAVTLHVAGLDLGALLPGLVLTRADVAAPDLRRPAQADVVATLNGAALNVHGTAGPLAGTALPLTLTLTAATPPLLEASAGVTLAWAPPHPAVRGTLAVARLDLDALLAALPAPPPLPAGAPGAAPPLSPRPARLIPDQPIDFAALRRADADLQISVASLLTGGGTYSNVTGHLALQDGRLALDPFAGQSPGGPLDGRLAIDASVPAPPVALVLHAPALSLAPLAQALGHPGALTGTAAVQADLKAAGDSPHALAASLTGQASLTASDAEIDDALLAALMGDVMKAARLPAKALIGLGRTRLSCLDLRLDAHDGVVNVASLLLDSPKLMMQGNGTVDLGPETLNLHLRPMLRVGPGIVVPVRVGGALREPKAQADTGAAGRAALLGALAGALGAQRAPPVPPTPCPAAP